MPCEQCENGKYKWGKTGSCKYDTKAECEEDNKDYYEDMKETKIVELVISDDSQELAIDAISLVTSPAIEQDFVFFGKEKNNLTFAKVDEEKRMLVSPALIPNKNIFRHDPNTDSDYYVYFSKETVRKAAELYLKHNNHHKATYQHQDRVSGVLTVESWIKEGDSDKSKLYGYDLPNGTWFVKMKIENDELWQKIKAGELKGLSIEGYFTNKFEQMQKKEFTTEEIRTALKELLSVQKVDLTVYSDLVNHNKTIKKDLPNKQSDVNEMFSVLKRKVQSGLAYTEGAISFLESDLKEFSKSSKEIGFNPNENDAYKDAQKTLAQAQEESKYYKKALASVKNFG
jgi:hypothetical protein